MAPPYREVNAATGTTASAQIAITIKPAKQAAGLAAREESPPCSGETEFSLEKGDAKSEAAENQRSRRQLLIE